MNGKKLYRSTAKRKLAGVCGGLEEFTGVDATLWRLFFILLALPGGLPGVIPYLIMWLIVPEKSDTANATPEKE